MPSLLLFRLATTGLAASFLFFSAAATAQQTTPPTGTLVKRTISTGTDPNRDGISGIQVAVDANGNIYTTGDFYGTINLGGISFSSPNGYDSYLAKYSSSGTLLWAQHMNGANYETLAPALTLDAAGNAYLTGSFYGSLSIGGTTLTDPSYNQGGFGQNGYLAKFTPQGTLQWAQRLGAATAGVQASAGGHELAVDASGNLLVTAWFSGTATLGSTSLTSATGVDAQGNVYSSQDFLLAKLDPQGNVLWARREGSSRDEDAYGLAVDPAGNIFVGGLFYGPLTIGGSTLNGNTTDSDGFVAKYNSAGTPQWAARMPAAISSIGDDVVRSLSADAAGNVVLLGDVQDPTAPAGQDGYRTVVARYSPQGVLAWSQVSTGLGDSYEGTILTDAAGNSYACGTYVGGFSLGTATLSAPDPDLAAAFVISLNPQGAVRWSLTNGGTGEMSAQGLALDAVGQLYVTGSVLHDTDFAGLPLPANGANNESYFVRLTNVVTGTRPEQKLAALSLFPNPTQAATTVQLPAQSQAGRVEVRDLTGRLLQQVAFPAAATQVTLSLKSVAAGLYMVQVVTDAGTSPLSRLVVQ